MTTSALAASAYASLADLGTGSSSGRPAATGGGFGDMLEQAISGVADKGRASEARAMEAVAGRGDVVDVVTAVAESELALETLVSVRDKVIAAYEDVMRMPI
ncbi:flagellar hook-basal body complex protein FliE [Methylopila musalis]|uniref:Flagellar hook-basal body complex protein FliE n=1 Tax=Methylopila musalis TaxID=1134781 RepID=A0ABW3Z821_9HYPH